MSRNSDNDDRRRDESREPFLRRWSRRRSESLRGEPEDSAIPTDPERKPDAGGDPVDNPDEPVAEAGVADADPPGDEDMPPLESIDEGGGVSDFFSPRVSRQLRRAALRRLFRQGSLKVVDDLDDYAEDYARYSNAEGLVTTFMQRRLEELGKRLADNGESGDDGVPAEERRSGTPTVGRDADGGEYGDAAATPSGDRLAGPVDSEPDDERASRRRAPGRDDDDGGCGRS
ncbi:MAG: DUF3306 domain-containing protein [Wenzhouxiangellaceae bacterium]|nr:DUF3306 domain-containing protein [Wenzhouxiangellaceae bacterium]